MSIKVWDEIIYPFPNFNGMDVITVSPQMAVLYWRSDSYLCGPFY